MANPYKALLSILPQEPLQVGEVQSSNGNGTSLIQLVGGGDFVTVSGPTFANGTPVFVKGTRILSEAPSLAVQDIQV